jgi:hypothetical protein
LPLLLLLFAILGSVPPGSILLVRPWAKALFFINITIFLAVLIGISLFKVIKYLIP